MCVCVCVCVFACFLQVRFAVLFLCCGHHLTSEGAHFVCLLRFLAICFCDVKRDTWETRVSVVMQT